MIQPIIRVDSKELIWNQTFLLEEKSEHLDITVPFMDKKDGELKNLQIRFVFDIKNKNKLGIDFQNGVLNIHTRLPKDKDFCYSKDPISFDINNNKFFVYVEIQTVQELYKMTVSIYREDK